MNLRELKAARGDVVDKFADLETFVNLIICHYFLKRIDPKFILEVLYDEQFSFGLRRNVLEKVVPDFDRKQMENLHRINKLRNYFAHCGLTMSGPPFGDSVYPSPRKGGKEALDWDALYREFTQKAFDVHGYLVDLMHKMDLPFAKEEDQPPRGSR